MSDATARWRSLEALVALAHRLPGDTSGDVAALERWFERQLERVEDRAFARRFSDHVDLPGIAEADYLHRIVEIDGLRVLGGIRFYGEDVSRPFVEVVAWTLRERDGSGGASGSRAPRTDDPWHPKTVERLRAAVAREWRMFTPTHLRLHRPETASDIAGPPRPMHPEWITDVAVHVGDACAKGGGGDLLTLVPFDDLADAVALVDRRYEALRQQDPALARNVTPADAAELVECNAAGSLFAMWVDGVTVGLIATLADAIDWIAGDVVVEEVVSIEHAGHGYAAEAQRALMTSYARSRLPRRLIGTIDGANVASRRSAVRADRPAVSRHLFLPLPSPDR